jgi:hypothetical protein
MQAFCRPSEVTLIGDHPEIAQVMVVELGHLFIYIVEPKNIIHILDELRRH